MKWFPRRPHKPKFQSLIGFKINWNPFMIDHQGASGMFQSLIGFKINWNPDEWEDWFMNVNVSIPNRV